MQGLHVAEGDSLQPGQLIAELDAPELATMRAQIAAELAEAEAGPRREEIDAARHEWEAIDSELGLARIEEKRARELLESKTSTQAEYDRSAARVRTLERNRDSAKSRLDLLLAGTRPERIAQTKARLAEVDTQIAELRVAAPTNCVVEILSVKAGDVLAPNREIATLLLTQHLWVRVFVPQPWLGHIKTGDPVKLRADAFPEREINGVVEQLSREAEFTPRNVQTVGDRIKQVFGVKIRLTNADGSLHAGMSADAFFPNVPPSTRELAPPP